MSASDSVFQTKIFISPDEYLRPREFQTLPLHVNVVDSFAASHVQVSKLTKNLVAPLFRNTFEITGFEHGDRGNERVQRLGGSVLHGLHDDITDVLDRLDIVHDNAKWGEDSADTWYTGTWYLPERRAKIKQVHVAQETQDAQSWHIIRTYNLYTPSDNFRDDPLYLESSHRLGSKRRAD